MTEQQYQSKIIKEYESKGWYVLKLIKTNKNGIPDIIAIPPNSNVIFSEVKTPKGRLSKLQEFRLKELEKEIIAPSYEHYESFKRVEEGKISKLKK